MTSKAIWIGGFGFVSCRREPSTSSLIAVQLHYLNIMMRLERHLVAHQWHSCCALLLLLLLLVGEKTFVVDGVAAFTRPYTSPPVLVVNKEPLGLIPLRSNPREHQRTNKLLTAQQQQRYHRNYILRRAAPDDENASSANTQNPWLGHDMYQRILYRLSRGSDVSIPDAIIIEERCRFTVDPQRPDYMIPSGQRTLLLRNGLGMNLDEGEIGDDFYTVQVNTEVASTHNGAGNDPAVQSAIACAIYLSENPDLCQGKMLQVSAETGLGSLLGCIGAGYVLRHINAESSSTTDEMNHDVVDDILTIGKDRKGPFPPDLELLSITDVDDDQLVKIMNRVKALGFKSSKINLDVLDWRTRKIQPSMNRLSSSSSSSAKSLEYRTIVASDIVFSYPETKELARAVAHRLEPITPYLYQSGPKSTTTSLPSFVHICPDDRDDVTYLRRILEKGYRMAVSNKFLKLEKLIFHLQKLPSGQPESELDNIDLELKDCKEIKYQALVAQHHPDYAGGGGGEWFFPIETGEYEATGGSSFLEKEAGSSPW